MSQYFFTGTPLWELEREMMSVPNFDHREEKKITDCQLCSQYKARQPCLLVRCPYINARMLRGDLSLNALAWSMYRRYPNLLKRLDVFLLNQELRFFRHESHRQRWQRWHDRFYRMSKENKAALYLLTSYDAVWEKVIWHMDGKGFDFDHVRLGGLTTEQYAVYQAAKAIAGGGRNITIGDLTSPELVTDEAFGLITGALLLASFGDVIL